MDFVPFVVPDDWGNDFPKIQNVIRNQAHAALVPSCALAAIVKRESDGRDVFQTGVPRDSPDCGYGYCQITYGADRSDPNNPSYSFNGQTYDLMSANDNLLIAAQAFLAPAITQMLKLRDAVGTSKMPQEILYYAFAAYNAGAYRVSQVVRSAGNVDNITTDRYASGTLSLYQAAVNASQGATIPVGG